jgi:tRNA1(Val) A37 N6-methylase TrmN6
LGQEIADVIICNPPYSAASANVGKNDEIAISKHEIKIALNDIFFSSGKLLKFGGRLFIVHKLNRLADVCVAGRNNNLEVKVIKFISGNCVLAECMKGGKPGLLVNSE